MASRTGIAADIAAVNSISIVPSLLEAVCNITGMGFAAIARVDDEKWVACAVKDDIAFGLKPGGELKLESTICNEIRQHHKPVIIDHVAEDPDFCGHHTPATYGFQSYISIPVIRRDGTFFGTLCAIDPKPAKLKGTGIPKMFTVFAELISLHLDTLEALTTSRADLAEERSVAELREQFIAILGHDLRNPVGAINAGADLIIATTDGQTKKIAEVVKHSAWRINGLVDNVMDFAQGRMGSGISLNIEGQKDPENVLRSIITELQSINPGRGIETHFSFTAPQRFDAPRIGQLLSNLLANAIMHGEPAHPIRVSATGTTGNFTLSVSNRGEEIPPEIAAKLFQPFFRGGDPSGKNGLGLGLYIASEIAKAHNGKLEATFNEGTISFTLTMPA